MTRSSAMVHDFMRSQAARKQGGVESPAVREMTSPVNWALLGLVIKRPGYGYELAKRFQRDYGDVLVLKSDSHIYAGLNELVRRGFVEEVPGSRAVQSGAGRQPKPGYQVTASGVRAYRERLMVQVREDRRQSQLFILQLAALEGEPAEALQVIDCYEQACVEEAASTPVSSAGGLTMGAKSGLASWLVSEESRLAMQARLPWVEFARDAFRALGVGSGGDGPSGA
jgi:DNA-binding PadR family transcriptional regulator